MPELQLVKAVGVERTVLLQRPQRKTVFDIFEIKQAIGEVGNDQYLLQLAQAMDGNRVKRPSTCREKRLLLCTAVGKLFFYDRFQLIDGDGFPGAHVLFGVGHRRPVCCEFRANYYQ